MIVEVAIIRAKPGQGEAMQQGLAAAREVISRSEGYRGSRFQRGIEDPERFILYIEWDSVADHMEGFRNGPLFPQWRSHFGHLIDGTPDVQHYRVFAGP
ncbi:MAG TPA: antibiotic biosynthesis monooxygenase family protein [Chloroflexota bacterium]